MSMPMPIPLSLCSARLAVAALAPLAAFVVAFCAAPVHAGSIPVPPLGMFVTSTTGNGDFSTNGNWEETEGSGLTGFAAADKICQARAHSSGIASGGIPVYRAWVSIGTDDAYCHVLGLSGNRGNNCVGAEPFPTPGPYYRIDGVPFVDSLDSVGSANLGTASRSESGAFVSGVAWTGSNGDGTATALTCSGWGSTSGFGSVGSTTSEKFWGEVSGDGSLACGSDARRYCFQAPTTSVARRPWPQPAALVFARSGGTSGNFAGIDGADVVCQDQAAAAGLPGAESFRAWLSDFVTDAKDRLTINGPWARVDGVRVAVSKAALIDGNLDSAISRVATGAHLSAPDRAWTGTFGGGTKSTDRCSNWFSFGAGLNGLAGSTDETGVFWTSASVDACNQAGRWYCFGDVVVVFWDRFEDGNLSRWSATVGFVP